MLFKKLLIVIFIFSFTLSKGECRFLIPTKDTLITHEGDFSLVVISQPNSRYKKTFRLKNEKKEGLEEIIGNYGKLLESSNYTNGFLDGEQTLYDNQGNIREKRNYKYNKAQNRSVLEGDLSAFQSQILVSQTNYTDSLKNGVFKVFFPDGSLKIKGNNDAGFLSGKHEEYYLNGKIAVTQNYKVIIENGQKKSVLDGKYFKYNTDGKPLIIGLYQDGKKSGLWTLFYQRTGYVASETNYKDNQMHGAFTKYFEDGKIESRGTFYYEIEVDGNKLKSVNDGKSETYYRKGNLQLVQNFKMGKKEGLTQRFYENGTLDEQHNYKNNLEVGTTNHFDKKGNKTNEVSYAIITQGEKQVSVKNGFEYRWEDNVLVSKAYYKNGVEQGVKELFYKSGKPNKSFNIKDGVLHGEFLEYYESGKLKRKYNYLSSSVNDYSGKLKTGEAGWQYDYDSEGKIVRQRFNNPKWDNVTQTLFEEGKMRVFEIAQTFSVNYFPDGKLMSFNTIGPQNQTALGYYFYKNSQLRKIIYQDPETLKKQYADFLNDGTFLTLYTDKNNDEAKQLSPAYAKELSNYVNQTWSNSPLFLDIEKQGAYELKYNNNHLFLRVEFQDNLPNGEFLVLEPVRGDTLVYKNFKKGILVGDFVEKFAGKQVVRRGKYFSNGKLAVESDFRPDGTPTRKYTYNDEGKRVTSSDYYENGKLKIYQNEADSTFASYDQNGVLQTEKVRIEDRIGWFVNRQFYANSHQLKSESFYFQGKRDSTYSQLYENEQLEYRVDYKKNKRDGDFIEYSESGEISKKGQYLNDQMVGEWTIYNGKKAEKKFYENGKLVIKPLIEKCACADTTMSQSKLGYAPLLKHLVDLKTIKRNLPTFIKPFADFNYESIFYVNHQSNNGARTGGTSLKLVLFKELSFFLPANQQIKITLNPCTTDGYISTMGVTAYYNTNNEAGTYANLYPKRIALELINSPFKSADTKQEYFKALYNVKSIDYNYQNQFKVNLDKVPDACYTQGIIKDFLSVDINTAEPSLFDSEFSNNYNGYIWNENIRPQEANEFFGLWVKDANVKFEVAEKGKNQVYNVKSTNMLAGGKFVAGSIKIPCKKLGEDSYSIKDNPETFVFSSQNLKKEWMKKGFTRISARYDDKSESLTFNFFAE